MHHLQQQGAVTHVYKKCTSVAAKQYFFGMPVHSRMHWIIRNPLCHSVNGYVSPFAQLLKEHLQGEGQWLTRYGDAPDPTPGAGAGVVGGDRDGDVGFMGVEAMTRWEVGGGEGEGRMP